MGDFVVEEQALVGLKCSWGYLTFYEDGRPRIFWQSGRFHGSNSSHYFFVMDEKIMVAYPRLDIVKLEFSYPIQGE